MLKMKMLVGAVLAAVSTPSMAATTWYQFSGVVTEQVLGGVFSFTPPNPADPLDPTRLILVGDTISGRFLYEDAAAGFSGSSFWNGPLGSGQTQILDSQVSVSRAGQQRFAIAPKRPVSAPFRPASEGITIAADNLLPDSRDLFVTFSGLVEARSDLLQVTPNLPGVVSTDWGLVFAEKCASGSSLTNDCVGDNPDFDFVARNQTRFDLMSISDRSELRVAQINFLLDSGQQLRSGFMITSLSPASVPEPATWAMMIIGFGAVGGAARASRTSAKRGLRQA
jgi:hypothetical protein